MACPDIFGVGGIAQGRDMIRCITEVDDDASMGELSMRLHKEKIYDVPGMGLPRNRYSIFAEYCYGDGSSEIVRKYLDSGMLGTLADKLKKAFTEAANPTMFEMTPAMRMSLRLIMLAAGAMTHGAKLPAGFIDRIKEALDFPIMWLYPTAKQQVVQALQDYPNNGTPYDFGNESMLAYVCSMVNLVAGGLIKLVDHGPFKRRFQLDQAGNVVAEQLPAPAPTCAEVGFRPDYPFDVCGGCGRTSNKLNGGSLLLCASCKDRKYCSKQYQKRHWQWHKNICKLSSTAIEDMLSSVRSVEEVKLSAAGLVGLPH